MPLFPHRYLPHDIKLSYYNSVVYMYSEYQKNKVSKQYLNILSFNLYF